jgi:hypothetical protein
MLESARFVYNLLAWLATMRFQSLQSLDRRQHGIFEFEVYYALVWVLNDVF